MSGTSSLPAPESSQRMLGTARSIVAALGTTLRIQISDALSADVEMIRAFRAEVYFADGGRPSFRGPDGRFADPDEADLHSYHIVCRDQNGVIAGCLRLGRADLLGFSAVRARLGPEGAAHLLGELGIGPAQLFEGAGLAVTVTRRLQGVAAALVLAALALARHVQRPVIWATAGEGEGQYRVLTGLGFRVLPGSSAYVPRYCESTCVVVHDQRSAAPPAHQAILLAEQALFGDSQAALPGADP